MIAEVVCCLRCGDVFPGKPGRDVLAYEREKHETAA